jgi:hypothetical protein
VEFKVRIDLDDIAFGRGAYLLFLVGIIMALSFSDLPTPIFLTFLGVIVAVGLVAETLSWLASRKLRASSLQAAPYGAFEPVPALAFASFEENGDASVTKLLVTFGLAPNEEPEFAQIQNWFAKTSVGSFA